MDTIVYIVAIILLMISSAFFSMSETAFTSASEIKLKKLANEGNRNAEKAIRIIEGYDKFLTTILIGNNLVNIAASSLATTVFAILLGAETGAVASTVVMTLALLVFSEITPKALAKKQPERICLGVCTVVHWIMIIFSPLSWLFTKLMKLIGSDEGPTLTEDELEVMIDEIQSDGILEKRESELIKNAMRLDDIQVAEVYVHRTDIVAIDVDESVDDLGNLFVSSGYSRIPVYDDTIDNIIGVVYSKTYFTNTKLGVAFKIHDILMPVKYIPETVSVADALSEMQKSKMHMAVVLDSYGGTKGIITMEDLLEELVGDIWDESDAVQQDVRASTGGCYIVKGMANFDDVMDKVGIFIDRDGYEDTNFSGFIMHKLQRAPTKGDVVELDNATITVTNVKGHRVIDCSLEVKNEPIEEGSS
ncbi:MAG: HlyC/CorC family transporter [Candidatus Methanomethylophilaceae archaeon]|nr:HlyC/CorC family transporter [Candidatus Methanomethylophilaceae archaeon]MBR6911441.1 HlyC/CorC family transporter [Candidatus Methanomethylophilaceae archaeon]